jgi:hypothetical protein
LLDLGLVECYATARTAFLCEEDGSVAFLLLALDHLRELCEELLSVSEALVIGRVFPYLIAAKVPLRHDCELFGGDMYKYCCCD